MALSEDQRLDIAASYYAGERAEDLAAIHSCGIGTIYYVLEQQGVPKHWSTAEGRKRHPRTQDRPDLQTALPEIVAAYQAGAGSLVLGQRYQVAGTTIIRLLHRNGIPIRPAGFQKHPTSEIGKETSCVE